MVLLITATIAPPDNVVNLILADPTERLYQYLESLNEMISCKNINKIVFCDNSNYLFDRKDIQEKAFLHNTQIEFLSFCGNQLAVVQFGKGYGEGEIIDYALQNSQLLSEDSYFFKITGRIQILNLDKIVNKMNGSTNYFNSINPMKEKSKIDTRFYGIRKADYVQYFANAYKQVNDNENIYLEHVFYNIIKSKKLKVRNTPEYPNFIGVSGSDGSTYQTKGIKYVLKNIASMLNLYKEW